MTERIASLKQWPSGAGTESSKRKPRLESSRLDAIYVELNRKKKPGRTTFFLLISALMDDPFFAAS
jgi:hypothetical protein